MEIKAGTEFVYNINRNQIKSAVILYSYDLLISKYKKENSSIDKVFDIISGNLCNQYDEDDSIGKTDDKINDKFFSDFWCSVNARISDQSIASATSQWHKNSKHKGCRYRILYSKPNGTIYLYFESFAKGIDSKSPLWEGILDDDYKECIQQVILRNSADVDFNIQPQIGKKRLDLWSWCCEILISDNLDEDAAKTAEKFDKLYKYFEGLEIEDEINKSKNNVTTK